MSCIFYPLWVPMGILVGIQGLFTWCHFTPKTEIFAYLTTDLVAEHLLFSFGNKCQSKVEIVEKASKKSKLKIWMTVQLFTNNKSMSRERECGEHRWKRHWWNYLENVSLAQQQINISNQNKLLLNLIYSVQNPCPTPSKFCLLIVIIK